MPKQIASLLLLMLLSVIGQAQPKLSTKNKKAIVFYQSAIKAYDKYEYDTAEKELELAVDKDKNFIEAYLLMAQVYQETRRYEQAIEVSEKAIAINPDFFPNIYLNVGNLNLFLGRYQRALEHLTRFISYPNIRPNLREKANKSIATCQFAVKAIENPVPFNPISLGSNVNTPLNEYWPSLSADENTLVITVNLPKDSSATDIYRYGQEDFFISQRDTSGLWGIARNIGAPINTDSNEGAQSIAAGGNHMFYTVCRGVCNIYVADRLPDGSWGNPRTVPGKLNADRYSDKQPSISPDGNHLYFVSTRPGGFGGYDIWRSAKQPDGSWGIPTNLGATINSSGDEQSPFIHFDNQTLYFASNGHVGMGGLDLFVTRKQSDTTWSVPANLGYPINTYRDEDGLIVNARGTTAYYSSDRNTDTGRDIYTFALYPEVRPIPSSYITGTILDESNGRAIPANFQLIDLERNEVIMHTNADARGEYMVCIPSNRNYGLFASAEGYLYHSENFSLQGVHSIDKPFRKNIYLKPFAVGQVLVMRNIFFQTDSYELLSESAVELNRLVELLRVNPLVRIEVGGHTDNVGSDSYNQQLSEKRASSVAQYIIGKGIDVGRITWKGYGEQQPMSSNETEEGRAENRRTEIRIVGI